MLFSRFISERINNWVNKIQAEGGEVVLATPED